MKKILLIALLLVSFLGTKAQIVGGNAFMIGDFVEIGIHGVGGFEGAPWDTSAPPLPGAHFRSGNPYLGFVSNAQADGWVNYDGDFFTPGSPENGWGIELYDGMNNIRASNNCMFAGSGSDIAIPGAITGYTYTGGVHTVTWEGDFDSLAYSLHITILYTLHDSALAYNTTVTIDNLGDPIAELYYYRNIDPDNNQPITGDFTTTNTILAQASPVSPLAIVKAEQSAPWLSYYSISAADSMARVGVGGFSNRDASDIYYAMAGITGTASYSHMGDEAIAVAFKKDSLSFTRAASTSFSFLSSFKPGIVAGTNELHGNMTQLYPNPTNGLLNISTTEQVQHITVYNLSGVQQMKLGNTTVVDMSMLADGIYFVTVQTDRSVMTKKVVKQ